MEAAIPKADLTLEGVNKWYSTESHAVKDLDLTVNNGEFLIFVGPSGCGKSTLLRMIAGLERVDGGSIRMGERLMNRVPPKERDIAMVFQNYALYPTMKVYDNMAFPLKMRRWKRSDIKKRVLEVAESLDLTDYLNRRPGALSGGQRQRVALGRAMVRSPSLFLMDEPLSNLDAKLRVKMRREIVELQRRLGVTTIYVTHDQTEAMTMGTRIAVMKDGVLQQVDTPQRMYDAPRNLFVAQFIGSPPMNIFSARLLPDLAAGEGQMAGIRPEHLTPEEGGEIVLTGQIDGVEHTGRESIVYFTIPDFPPLALSAPAGFTGTPGEMITCSARRSQVLLFDGESGERVERE